MFSIAKIIFEFRNCYLCTVITNVMTTTAIVILFVFAFGASFTQRLTGFGFGIFIMAVLPHIMPSYGEATALSGLLALIGVSITAARMYKHLVWSKLWPLLLTFCIVSFFAISLVGKTDSGLLKHILGGVLIVISIYFFIISDKLRMSTGIPVQIGMGALSGIMGGLFAMQGPPAVIYFLSCTKTKEEYAAISSFFFIIGNVVMTVFRATQGFVTKAVGISWLIGLPAVLLGLWIGGKVYDRMPINVMKKAVYAFMAVAGIIALV